MKYIGFPATFNFFSNSVHDVFALFSFPELWSSWAGGLGSGWSSGGRGLRPAAPGTDPSAGSLGTQSSHPYTT